MPDVHFHALVGDLPFFLCQIEFVPSSPAQFPWYITWFAPLLCLYPQRGLLLLTALMPIYYLWFYFDARGEAVFFDRYIVWLQYLPVLLLLFFDYCLKPLSVKSSLCSGKIISSP